MESFKPGSWEDKTTADIEKGDVEKLEKIDSFSLDYDKLKEDPENTPVVADMGIDGHDVQITFGDTKEFLKNVGRRRTNIKTLRPEITIDGTVLEYEDKSRFIENWGEEILGLVQSEVKLNREFSYDREEAERMNEEIEYQEKSSGFRALLESEGDSNVEFSDISSEISFDSENVDASPVKITFSLGESNIEIEMGRGSSRLSNRGLFNRTLRKALNPREGALYVPSFKDFKPDVLIDGVSLSSEDIELFDSKYGEQVLKSLQEKFSAENDESLSEESEYQEKRDEFKDLLQ